MMYTRRCLLEAECKNYNPSTDSRIIDDGMCHNYRDDSSCFAKLIKSEESEVAECSCSCKGSAPVVNVGEIWINYKTGDKYKVDSIARAAWDCNQQLIVYHKYSDDDVPTWVRSMTEFIDKFYKETSDDKHD